MIKVSGLTKTLSGQSVLADISFDVKDGEILVVLGRSGTGKSVLLQHLIGLMKPERGQVEIDTQIITDLSERELLKVRKSMGFLFQEGALFDFMDVFDNVAFPLKEHTTMTASQIAQRVREVLDLVDLNDIETKMPSELSGGMKKRVSLARAIILNPKVLFCDEPTSGLDPLRSRDISNLLRSVVQKIRCTTVITSHDIENSLRVADRLMLLDDGKIVILGTKEEINRSEIPFVQDFFGLTNVKHS